MKLVESSWLRVESPSVLGGGQFFFEIDDFFYLNQEPPVDFGQTKNLFDGEAGAAGARAGPSQPAVWFGSCH